MSANSRQVGGQHYKSEWQHWDFIEECGIGYLEAAATKYVMRWREKNGVQDLEKAVHYTEKLLELHINGDRGNRGYATLTQVQRFCQVNGLQGKPEADIVKQLAHWSNEDHLKTALIYLNELIQAEARGLV